MNYYFCKLLTSSNKNSTSGLNSGFILDILYVLLLKIKILNTVEWKITIIFYFETWTWFAESFRLYNAPYRSSFITVCFLTFLSVLRPSLFEDCLKTVRNVANLGTFELERSNTLERIVENFHRTITFTFQNGKNHCIRFEYD